MSLAREVNEDRRHLTGSAPYERSTVPRALARHDRLKEGHYDEWLERMLDLPRKYDLHTIVERIVSNTPESGFTELQESYTAAWLVQASVRTHLLERIGLETRRRGVALVLLLRKHCQPFRIMDLPPELRVRIYDMVPDLTGHTTMVTLKIQPGSKIQSNTKSKNKKSGKKSKKSRKPKPVQDDESEESMRVGSHYIPGVTQAN